jgi:hypothetical protein
MPSSLICSILNDRILNDRSAPDAVSLDTEGAIVVSYKLGAPEAVQPDLFDTERSDTERKVN